MRIRAWIVLALLVIAVIAFGQLGMDAQQNW